MPALFKIGCDPEVMLEKDGSLKSAIPIVPGTKYEGYPVKKGKILSDNVNLEFNTEPAETAVSFASTIKTVLKDTLRVIGSDYKLVVRASSDFPESELSDPRAKQFGCEPDFDAWKLCVNQVEADAASKSFRSAGGHIHIGATSKSKFLYTDEGKVRMVKAMDAIAGVISVMIDNDPTSIARRKLYGRAGCHRPKEYGVEYRALGNFWVKSPKLVKLMYKLTEFAVKLCLAEKEMDLVNAIGEDRIVSCINESNKEDAHAIFDTFLVKVIGKSLAQKVKKLNSEEFDFYSSWGL